MKLRRIALTGGLLLSLFVFSGNFFFSTIVIQNGFSKIEKQYVLDKLHAAHNEIRNTVTQLDQFLWDWSSWDDTYIFAQDANEQFITSNLVTNTFLEQELSAVIIRNTNKNVVFARAVTPEGSNDRALLADVLKMTEKELPPLEENGGRGGIALLGGKLFNIASRPILTSDGDGAPTGTIAMVRRISPALVEKISNSLGYDMVVVATDVDKELASRLNTSPTHEIVIDISTESICGGAYIYALDGEPAAIIKVTMAKDISKYGHTIAIYNNTIIAVAILLFSAMIYLLIHHKVLKRLEGLSQQVIEIQKTDHDKTRVEVSGNDEITDLTKSVNILLEEVDKSHQDLVDRAEKLSENEQFLQQVLDSISVGIIIIDPESRKIVAVNNYALAMAGREREEVLGNVCHKLTCPSEINNCPILDKHQSKDLSRRKLLTKSGAIIPIMKSVCFINRHGKPLLLETLIDITEVEQSRRELEKIKESLEQTVSERTKDLAEANKDLIALDKAKSLFLSSASHELRTPLTSILGFLKLMEKNFTTKFHSHLEQNEDTKPHLIRFVDNLHVVRGEAERLGRLVNDLLDLNKIESGRMQWRDEPLDVRELATHAMHAFEGQAAEKKHVEFVVELPDEEIILTADQDRILQVLINLLSNAFKFTNKGHVKLIVQPEDLNQAVSFAICDTGSGIPEESQGQVFDLFYQVQDVDKRSSKAFGTGLGLAICRQIVTHYGGLITLESKEGRGSCFVVKLPLDSPKA